MIGRVSITETALGADQGEFERVVDPTGMDNKPTTERSVERILTQWNQREEATRILLLMEPGEL